MSDREREERSRTQGILKAAEASRDLQAQKVRLLENLQSELNPVSNYFDTSELDMVSRKLAEAKEELEKLTSDVDQKHRTYEKSIKSLEKALDVRSSILEQSEQVKCALESDSELMDLFVSKHSEIIKHLTEQRMLMNSM
jgi:predicted ribosome quality control (RQC) complex YloA/Tae2 family protein